MSPLGISQLRIFVIILGLVVPFFEEELELCLPELLEEGFFELLLALVLLELLELVLLELLEVVTDELLELDLDELEVDLELAVTFYCR
jgi:hypothetical protein